MKISIFGLSISSSWGNGHATIWRGLIKELVKMKHSVIFFEKDVPYYASTRDILPYDGMQLILYKDWESVRDIASYHLSTSDVVIVTSFCPDAIVASEMIDTTKNLLKLFYDLDSPITLAMLDKGKRPDYIGQNGLSGFDIVLSYTGGTSLNLLKNKLEAKKVFPLYGCVDIDAHFRTDPIMTYCCNLSYMGTFSEDRNDKLIDLLIKAAHKEPKKNFIIAGAQYPENLHLPENIIHFEHVPPNQHPAFFSSSTFTLNLTRGTMASMGYCPSGRIFEAAACQVPILSDWWEGLDMFFEPEKEILIVNNTEDVIRALTILDETRIELSQAAFNRIKKEHTSQHRAQKLISIIESA